MAAIPEIAKGPPTLNAMKVREVKVPLVDAAILAVASKLSLQGTVSLNEVDEAVLAALRRAHPAAGDTEEELGRWLAEMDEAQLSGVVSNTKGVLHEMRFVALENSDGDTIFAAQFEAINHPGYDVVFSDHASGTEWVAQLKATSSEAYVEEWLEQHPDGEIIITSELAERMGLQDSGFANAELTADTEELVDQLISAEQNDAIWEYIPGLTALSIAAVVYEMHRRLLRGEISRDEFIWMTAKATGKSAARVLVLTSLLSIPFISFITALALIANILSQTSFIGRVNAYIERKRAVIDAVKKFQLAAHSEKLIIEGALKSAHLQREIIASLEGKSEEATNIYWKEYRRTLAGLDERGSTRDKIRLSYNDPSEYIPPEHHDGQVEDSIRAKINELEGGRLQLFAKARVAMNDAGLSASFIGFIKDTLDKQQAEALIFKINGDSEYIKRP